jgi:thiol-disulfide isomerase/thioredoxin
MTAFRTRRLGAAAAALLAGLTLAGCSGSGDSADEALRPRPSVAPTHAGASALPGPVPADVEFVAPPTNSASAPPLELTLVDGSDVDVTELWAERPVVLHFFSSWCTTCEAQQAEMNALAERYKDVIAFVGVAGEDESAAVNGYVDEQKVTYPVALDTSGDLWKRYAVAEPPLVALVGKGGRLLYGAPGEIDLARLEERIKAQIAR